LNQILNSSLYVNFADSAKVGWCLTALSTQIGSIMSWTFQMSFRAGDKCMIKQTSCVGETATICPTPCKLTFDLLTFKVVSETCVMRASSVPILIFLGLSVLDLGPMYTTDRQTSDAHHCLMPPLWGREHNNTFQPGICGDNLHCSSDKSF